MALAAKPAPLALVHFLVVYNGRERRIERREVFHDEERAVAAYMARRGRVPRPVRGRGGAPGLRLPRDAAPDPRGLFRIGVGTRPSFAASVLTGAVMNGNTRVFVLRGRGVDVETLPRKPYEP